MIHFISDAVLSGSRTLEFPVQGTALNTPGESAGSDVIFSAPNANIKTGRPICMSGQKYCQFEFFYFNYKSNILKLLHTYQQQK